MNDRFEFHIQSLTPAHPFHKTGVAAGQTHQNTREFCRFSQEPEPIATKEYRGRIEQKGIWGEGQGELALQRHLL